MFTGSFIWGVYLMIELRENPNFLNQLEVDVGISVGLAASSAVDSLADRISAGGRSGRHYDKYPRRSSAPGEYPQEQFGDLRSSVDSIQSGTAEYMVGFFGEDLDKLLYLEFRGDPMTGKGRRQPLYMHFAGRDSTATLNEMAEAIQGSR